MTQFLEYPSHKHGIAFVRPNLKYIIDIESHVGDVGGDNEIEGPLVIEEELEINENIDIEEELGTEENIDMIEDDKTEECSEYLP